MTEIEYYYSKQVVSKKERLKGNPSGTAFEVEYSQKVCQSNVTMCDPVYDDEYFDEMFEMFEIAQNSPPLALLSLLGLFCICPAGFCIYIKKCKAKNKTEVEVLTPNPESKQNYDTVQQSSTTTTTTTETMNTLGAHA